MLRLAEKAQRVHRDARRATGNKALSEKQRSKLLQVARDLADQARAIQKDAAAGIELSLNEQDLLDADFARVKKVVAWLRKRAAPPASPSPAPSVAESPSPSTSPSPSASPAVAESPSPSPAAP